MINPYRDIFDNISFHHFINCFKPVLPTGFTCDGRKYVLKVVVQNVTKITLFSTVCPPGFYGSNCIRRCHCNISTCYAELGCVRNTSCHSGYNINFCQGLICFYFVNKNTKIVCKLLLKIKQENKQHKSQRVVPHDKGLHFSIETSEIKGDLNITNDSYSQLYYRLI